MVRLVAKKQLGQNFLTNKAMQVKVANLMQDFTSRFSIQNLVEIGSGQGDITEHILQWSKELLCIEIDLDAVNLLEQKFANHPNFKLIQADALELLSKPELQTVLPQDFVLLSSLPYNVGSRILVELAIYFPSTPFAVILQSEVIDKMQSKYKLSFFGAWLNLFWNIKKVLDIAPGNFTPVPKVYSSMVLAIPQSNLCEWLDTPDKRLQAKYILKGLFAMPSKTIENNLKKLNFSAIQIELILKSSNLELGQRLSWENYQTVLQNSLKTYFFKNSQ